MPRRNDLHSVLIIGSGPIIIGQACEFDYSGTQACKALREDGYKVILVNSNPATIMTDPEVSDRTYIEPLSAEVVAKIIEKERPDALLPTLGGQTGLNLASALWKAGVLQRYGVEMLGANYDVIKRAEDREEFKKAIQECGLDLPKSIFIRSLEEARQAVKTLGLPLVIRPSYTLGGTGGGLARTQEEFEAITAAGLQTSPEHSALLEESIEGWKEFELEVMRDRRDNAVIVCSIENFDAMGVHTGDSITVAPAQTLTDKEYQIMRNAAIAIIRKIGVETGGSNIQFAIEPRTGRMVVIEMNPRVSRSSALASKATGFPIAKIATKLAVGYTLDEIPNDITKKTPACFEPSIDYCVVKIPRFDFAKFPDTDPVLTTQMKSVGEVMAIGRTFKEALQKAIQSLEVKLAGLGLDPMQDRLNGKHMTSEELRHKLRQPNSDRLYYIRHAFRRGMSMEEVYRLTSIDPWFLDNLLELVEFEEEIAAVKDLAEVPPELLRKAKRLGYSDLQLANAWASTQGRLRELRKKHRIEATFKLVDTCAAEFEAYTPYYYSTYEVEDETRQDSKGRRKGMILGGGPNRIGQGIEFDYCCVHAALSLKEEGWETIMVNSNPETVSTDYDISDKLYFEPLTLENVLNIYDKEKPDGLILQLGGQTPLNLARGLQAAGVPILGTSPESIDLAEDRERFKVLLERLGLLQPANGTALRLEEARQAADQIGYPVLVRPSYVLGGRAMEIVWEREQLDRYVSYALEVNPGLPILIDKFIEEAIEVDVDCIADGEQVMIGGIMEHIEEAGVHSGDSSCTLPPYSLKESVLQEIRKLSRKLGLALEVQGLMNIQLAIKGDIIYILEVNPRASRTIPFVSKAINVPLAKLAAKVMIGKKLKDLDFDENIKLSHIAVKKSVFPFNRFPNTDIILGPEMKSTGEVMGIDDDFGMAFAKSHIAATQALPMEGKVFISVNNRDKKHIPAIVRDLIDLGFKIVATPGTRRYLLSTGIEEAEEVQKIATSKANVLDLMDLDEIKLLINTPTGRGTHLDEARIRMHAIVKSIPCITTIPAARAAVNGIRALKGRALTVRSMQDYFPKKG
ncbi:MAG: carbamoyl-phosphate synthase large subunit [Planctomycetes bacterium]|nr:carbamoyl-phosphate synthase large subunit [Planctomycetota bacterium]